jgi:hypothetical protein
MNYEPEVCINIWLIADEDTQLIYRAAARGYALIGTDEDKAQILKSLASSDFHLAKQFSLSQYKTVIVDSQGEERQLVGLFVRDLDINLPNILQTMCSELEESFEPQFIMTMQGPKKYIMKIPKEPYYVLTFIFENDNGVLTPKL